MNEKTSRRPSHAQTRYQRPGRLWRRRKRTGGAQTRIVDRKLFTTGALLVIGITIHNLPEGIAVGAGYMHSPKFGLFIALAILLHNIPEGIATALPLCKSGVCKWDSFKAAFLSGLAEPVGALAAALFLKTFEPLIPAALAFAGGVMMFITLDELVPVARSTGTSTTPRWGSSLARCSSSCYQEYSEYNSAPTGTQMAIIDDLLASIDQQNLDAPIRSVLVGIHWTVVCSRGCGMAASLTDDQPHGRHNAVRDVGRLHTKSARELAEFARSENPLEASLGVAAINSLLEMDASRAVELNAVDVLIEHGRGKNVALVGHFPFIPRLRSAVGQLWVIEQRPVDDDFPAEAAAGLIPQADVVAITSSALINHTLDGLLALCRPGALVMALGPSTPLSPVLFDHGIDILSGARVVDEAAVLRTAGQGATFQQVEGARLLNFKKDTGE